VRRIKKGGMRENLENIEISEERKNLISRNTARMMMRSCLRRKRKEKKEEKKKAPSLCLTPLLSLDN
jgi:hypothetical protein